MKLRSFHSTATADAWRLRAQSVALLLLLAVSCALAWDGYTEHRSFNEHVRRSAAETAREAAGSLARLAQNYELALVFRSIAPITSHLSEDTPDARARFLRTATQTATGPWCASGGMPCEQGPALYVFHINFRTGGWNATRSIDPALRRWIHDSVTYEATHEYKPSWELAALDTTIAGMPHVVAYRVAFDAEGRPATANGMEIDIPRAARQAFSRAFALSPLLTSPVAQGQRNDSLYVVDVIGGGGRLLFHGGTGAVGSDGVMVHGLRGTDFGKYDVHLSLQPRLTDALGDIVGRARTVTTTYVLFGLCVILIAFAIAQARREYQLARLREAFVANVSHELRTPLAQIRIYAEALQFDYVRGAEARTSALGIISNEAVRLTHLIENVLTYTRASRGSIQLPAAPVEIVPVLTDVARRFEPLAARAGVAIDVCVEGAPVAVGERAAIDQIVTNLVDNAVRYAPMTDRVVLRAHAEDGQVLIAVEDRGPGIARRDRLRIWERFVRLDAARGVPGTGIGLAVVTDLATAMNGRAWVTESVPHGATFIVELPAADGGRGR